MLENQIKETRSQPESKAIDESCETIESLKIMMLENRVDGLKLITQLLIKRLNETIDRINQLEDNWKFYEESPSLNSSKIEDKGLKNGSYKTIKILYE